MFEKFQAKQAARRLLEGSVYERVAEEIESGIKKKGLWAKAIANSDGNEAKAKSLYIGYRAQALIDEATLSGLMESEASESRNEPPEPKPEEPKPQPKSEPKPQQEYRKDKSPSSPSPIQFGVSRIESAEAEPSLLSSVIFC